MVKHRMNDKQQLLVNEYFQCGLDRKTAMLRAGYSPSMARSRQKAVFEHPAVKAAIRRRQARAADNADVSVEWVIARLREVADLNLAELLSPPDQYGDRYVDVSEATDEQLAGLAGLEVETYREGRGEGAETVKRVKVKPGDKIRALGEICRIMGYYQDKLQVTGEVSLVERLQAGRARAHARNKHRKEEKRDA